MQRDALSSSMNPELSKEALSRSKFQRLTPSLSDAQTKVLFGLREKGIASASFDDLFGWQSRSRWDCIEASVNAFVNSEAIRCGIEEYQKNFNIWVEQGYPQDRVPRDYILRSLDGSVDPDDPLFLVGIDSTIIDIVNSYSQFWSKLNQFSLFYNVPAQHTGRIRVSSQRWHRDMWNQVKVFLYFTDVTEGNGALECVPESRHGGRYETLWPFGRGPGPPGYLQPPEELIESSVPPEGRTLLEVKRGSFLFLDTSLLHRGGFVRTGPRVVGSWAFYSPAVQMSRDFYLRNPLNSESLSEAAAFALS